MFGEYKTVGDLIEKLEQYDRELPVSVYDADGEPMSPISEFKYQPTTPELKLVLGDFHIIE